MVNPTTPVENNKEVQALQRTATTIATRAANYAVVSGTQYEEAAGDLKEIKTALRKMEDLRKSFTAPLDQAKRAIMDFFRPAEGRLLDSEARIKRAMLNYQEIQERARREEQQRADAAARKERERLEAQAKKAADKGQHAKAEAIDARAMQVAAPVVQPTTPKVSGISTRPVWKFEITDEMAVPRQYLAVDLQAVGAVVRALKGQTDIPGVRVWEEKSMAAGRT